MALFIPLNLKRPNFCIILLLLSIVVSISAEDVYHDRTFLISPLYADLKPDMLPVKEVNVKTAIQCAAECLSHVTDPCHSLIFNGGEGICSIYDERLYLLSFVEDIGSTAYETFPEIQSDCYDVMMNGGDTSGIYTIQPTDTDAPINVSCEMPPDDGGWLVIQRRTDGSEDFYRTWDEYTDGFGDLNHEFWLGNENIYRISDQTTYDLRIELEDFEGNSRYAVYKDFYLEREVNDFRLSIGEYSGTAGDGLSSHYGQPFSTWDRDLDSASGNCAQSFHGAWWYFDCYRSNLNGGYLHGNHSADPSGVSWYPWRGMHYSLKSTVMKIRPSPVMAYSNWDVRR